MQDVKPLFNYQCALAVKLIIRHIYRFVYKAHITKIKGTYNIKVVQNV